VAEVDRVWEGLARFAATPEWLAALDDPTRVQTALDRVLPGLGRARLSGVRLKPEAWTARCALVPDGGEQVVPLAGTILPPGHGEPASITPPGDRPGNDGWRCWLPELRLELVSTAEQDEKLPALGPLTDPERAGSLLESAIRAGAPAYGDIRILAATPKVARYSPGSRCTVVYRLALPAQPQAATWPDVVVAKTYHRSDKGRIAWDGMRALWRSPLAGSGVVAIAEPLAWLPQLNILVQRAIPHQRTLRAPNAPRGRRSSPRCERCSADSPRWFPTSMAPPTPSFRI
jgi:hypothetical protein